MENIINKNNLVQNFKEILNSLSTKERDVIEKRLGINGQKYTLQSIGDTFSPIITRERVRQIEDCGIKKIGRIIKASNLIVIQDYAKELIELNGGIITKEKVINEIIKKFSLTENINKGLIDVILQSDYDIVKSKPKLGTISYFYFPNIAKKNIDLIHKEAVKILKKKKDVMEKITLYELIKINLNESEIKNVFIDSVLDIFQDIVKGEKTLIGLTQHRILNPKTLKDKAIYVLKKEKLPMHFVSITNKISELTKEKVKVNTVHNELIRNDRFVLIGRGIYALKDWGIYKPGNVIDVIVEVMKKNQEPMSTEDIINKVSKVRQVKKSTIYMNLQNKQLIQRVGRNFYKLK